MTNFDTAREALETSLNSSGSALEEHEKWQKSLEAQSLKLKAAWQSLSQTFLKSDFLHGALEAVIGLVDGIEGLIDTLGTLPTLALAFTAFQSVRGGGIFKTFKDEATGAATGITNVFKQAAEQSNKALQNIGLKDGTALQQSLADDKAAFDRYMQAIKNNVSEADAYSQHLLSASAALQHYANTGKLATDGIEGFAKQQQLAELSLQAQNKTLGNAYSLLKEYYGGCKTTGLGQTEFAEAVAKTNPQLAKQMGSAKGAKSAFVGYGASLVGATIKTVALEVATMALNAALTMGISALISFGIKAFDKLIVTEEELAEKVEEVTTKFKEQSEELQKLKSDYDTSNESSMISRYEKLSKGVDKLGRNVSLTADEYSEYQSLVNKIAEQIPSLVSGYDSQGNAILSVKGNVEELTEAYEKLIHAQNQSILSSTGDIEDNYQNAIEKASGTNWWSNGHGFWAGLFGDLVGGTYQYSLLGKGGNPITHLFNYELKDDTVRNIEKLLENPNNSSAWQNLKNDRYSLYEIKDALTSAGIEVGWRDNPVDVLEEVLEENPDKIRSIIDNYYGQFDEIVKQQKTIATAKLSEAFDVSSVISGLNYDNISEEMQAVAYQVVNSLDKNFFDELAEDGETVEGWVEDMLDQMNSLSKEDNAKIEAAFDLQTQFNGGEISYGEYIQGLNEIQTTIDGLALNEETKTALETSLGLGDNGDFAAYQTMLSRLSGVTYTTQQKYTDEEIREALADPFGLHSDKKEIWEDFKSGDIWEDVVVKQENPDFKITEDEAQKFLDSLTSEEFAVLVDIIPELSATEYKETLADIESALELEMMLRGLTFDLNLEVETAGFEALNTALAESVSATGLSTESIEALKSRYSGLEAQGFDLSVMFEETSTGIRLNRQEFNKLETAYATDKLADVDGDLEQMKSTYDDLGEAIKNCDDPVKKSALFNDRQTLGKRISEAATLATQYKALTSAYNNWLNAEEAGQERDMYENVIKGFETVDDEISRGWIDDGTIEFLELLTGRTDLAGKSGKELKEIYDGLDKTIGNSGYSIRDFFTVNEDGESTNTGVYNFLETVESFEDKLGDVINRDGDGNIIGFDFQVAGGDEVIAETLGISEELVQIMIRAADDAGFVVTMDGTYKQLADLQNEARASANYLKEIGKTDVDFDFNTTSVENLKTQLEDAHKILEDKDFWNADGTFNFNADGATEAMTVVSTLQAKLDKLTEGQYGIGLTVEDEEFEEPLEKLQEYGYTIQTLNQLKLNPQANAEDIKELEGDLQDISEYFANLDGETKVKLGLDADDNWEDVKKKIENGEVKIPTVLDIQANMDKNIETLTDLALLNSGLLSEEEEEVIRKKYTIEPEVEVEDVVEVGEEIGKALSGTATPDDNLVRGYNIQVIAQTMGIEDVDNLSSALKGVDDKTVAAIAKAIGEGNVEALDKAIAGMDGNEVDAVCKALGYSDVETLKAAINNMQGNEVDAKVNTEGQAEKVWGLQDVIDGLKGKTVDIVTNIKKVFSTIVAGGSTRNDSNGFSDVNGTANINGTTGRAFARGDWRTKKTETALTGELGREIVVTPDNHWYTVGDNGAEFATIPRGSIVFNHKICGIA
jgi:hypothetical protein